MSGRNGSAAPGRPDPKPETNYRGATVGIDPDRSKGWLRRVAPIVLAHRTVFFGSMALALVANLLSVSIPALVRAAIDNGLAQTGTGQAVEGAVGGAATGGRSLGWYVAVILAVGLVRGLVTVTYRYGMYRTAFEIDSDLRTLLYRHLTRLSFSFYDRTQSGQIISRANSDIRSVQMFLTFAPLMSMTFVMFCVAIAYMLSIHVVLTLVSVAPLIGVYYFGKRLRDQVFPLSWIVQSRVADVSTIVDENINGVRVVRSFAAERSQIEALAKAATGLRWAGVRTVDARAAHNPIIENLPRVSTLLVLVYGGWLVLQGEVTAGTLFAFTAYVTMLQGPFRLIGLMLMLGQRARASAGRIYEVLDEGTEIADRPGAGELSEPRGLVEFDDVRFDYRPLGGTQPDDDSDDEPRQVEDSLLPAGNGHGSDRGVLDGFNLRIEPGETVAVVGRTGSGKSTVARLLARFYDVDGGAIRVDGHDVRDVTQASLRRAVGVVTDDPFLFSVSLGDNIAYGRPGAGRDEIRRAARMAEADGFISDLPDGYDEVVGERGYTLSGGQRQRVAIARTLLAAPRVLVLDDATSAVDVTVEERILDAIRTLGDGTTVVLIAHRLSTIAAADRVVFLDRGRVRAAGAHEVLMATEPAYAEVLAHLDDGSADDGSSATGSSGSGSSGNGSADRGPGMDPTGWGASV